MAKQTGIDRVSPSVVVKRLAEATPEAFKKNIVVIGSIAAGYRYFGEQSEFVVQTKDIDCLLRPYIQAVEAGEAITDALMDSGWTYAPTDEFPEPGTLDTPDDQVPVVRLNPPGETGWFVELLTVGESEENFDREFIPLKTAHGVFSLCAFGGIRLAQWDPILTDQGIAVARPEMMVLSNLLHHKKIGEDLMAQPFAGRSIKRSNKDLGRVLALAYLAERDQENVLLEWTRGWKNAVTEYFPTTWKDLCKDAGAGLREMLNSPNDLDEAHHTCQSGLVAVLQPSLATLTAAGERLLGDVIEPLEQAAQKHTHVENGNEL
ncbi:MAG: hypothetical protein P1V20_21510 [Verrucomicrobiales bacterium]|nr:hypothetical protein [Verrucomicrobiales bacterium]